MSSWNVAPPGPEKSKRNRNLHIPFDASCRCDMCLNRISSIKDNVGQPAAATLSNAQSDGVRAKVPAASSSSSAWHRVGWETRPRRHCMRQPLEPPVEVEPGPTREKEAELALNALAAGGPGRQYHGPVLLKPSDCTYLHSRSMQHSHRTVFLSSLAPKRDSNYGSLLSELDLRLENLHDTIASVSRNQLGRVDNGCANNPAAAAGGATASSETIAMRHAVNQSLEKQMEFFTGAMATWLTQGKCCGCSGAVEEPGQPCCGSCHRQASLTALRAKAQHHQQVLKQMGVGTS